jgi:hypothetical protein
MAVKELEFVEIYLLYEYSSNHYPLKQHNYIVIITEFIYTQNKPYQQRYLI